MFRLTFWRRQAVPSNTMPEHAGYEAKELEISGAKVGDILVWTQGEGVARKRREHIEHESGVPTLSGPDNAAEGSVGGRLHVRRIEVQKPGD